MNWVVQLYTLVIFICCQLQREVYRNPLCLCIRLLIILVLSVSLSLSLYIFEAMLLNT